ncbi:DUF2922 domain-containing protein [Bacillus carboniphilus]|uniref:DUF2922 domain-containing protein n=1 Tax=Bacillus carboniphilus TaxID=86663 RepID=A0ABY9JUV5_9BACI|nr:DUF2922 domain-containing protein [Bacillus carboniphilus]WLR43167.1 DUF2922 domain-containing protein [Bacillus carboniphilus]
MSKKLEMKFLNETGKTITITVDEPKGALPVEEVDDAMDTILTNDIFFANGGKLVSKKEARIVERNVNTIFSE